MSREEFIIQVFCIVYRFLTKISEGKPLRRHGPAPRLSDVEAITIRVVGEFLGIDGDKGIWEYFKANWSHFFPKLGDRTGSVLLLFGRDTNVKQTTISFAQKNAQAAPVCVQF